MAAARVASELEPSWNWLSCCAITPSSSMRLRVARSGSETTSAVVAEAPTPTVIEGDVAPGPGDADQGRLRHAVRDAEAVDEVVEPGLGLLVDRRAPGRATSAAP